MQDGGQMGMYGPVRGRGALSLRLRAQALSRTGRGAVAAAEVEPVSCPARRAQRCRFGWRKRSVISKKTKQVSS
jgi:hypothetical protein